MKFTFALAAIAVVSGIKFDHLSDECVPLEDTNTCHLKGSPDTHCACKPAGNAPMRQDYKNKLGLTLNKQ